MALDLSIPVTVSGRRVIVIDGGMGKELRRIGAPFRQPEWSALALLEEPSRVSEAHVNFIEAGAEVITTNSYAVVPFHLGQDRFDSDGARLAEVSGVLAREAADKSDRTVLVAGSLPPLFGSYQPELFVPAEAPRLIDTLITALAPNIDFWLAETIGSLQEFQAVLDGLERHSDNGHDRLGLWASFSVADEPVDGKAVLRSGETLEELALATGQAHRRGEIDALLFNCSQPEAISLALDQIVPLLEQAETLRIGAYANAFPGHHDDDENYAANEFVHEPRPDLTPERYAEICVEWINAGADIVGGCCDIGPSHIAALVDSVGGSAAV